MARMDTEIVHIPAYSGRTVAVQAGQLVTVTDVEGQQVGDLWAFDASDPSRWLSTSHTRDRLERLFPALGQSFTDQCGEPILEYVTDTSPGRHDMLFAPCDRWLCEAHGLTDHPNCRDSFLAAAGAAGLEVRAVPDPVNVFMDVAISANGTLEVLPAASAAGDHVTFRARRPLILVLTACSVDYWVTNGDRCTALTISVGGSA